jgi:hypothetical protein
MCCLESVNNTRSFTQFEGCLYHLPLSALNVYVPPLYSHIFAALKTRVEKETVKNVANCSACGIKELRDVTKS